jgi:squalene-hopene/tetraprenyl-beta-curcumene cyclase
MKHLPVWLLLLAAAAPTWSGCGDSSATQGVPNPSAIERIDRALAAAHRYLLAQQTADGSWRSDQYGPFKDGTALTPLVVQALQATSASPEGDAACRRGLAYLAAFAQPDGSIREPSYGLSYPVYTAAGAVALLDDQPRTAWLAYLRQRQLTEDLGWQPADREYGGWGYCPRLPVKPPDGVAAPPLTESNLSATVAALAAMRAAGVAADNPHVRKALVFVERCQNFGDDAKFDDGGFFFIYDNPVRNKAGTIGKDRSGRERFASYGSTTADGWCALLLCGLPADHARVAAARRWLEANFSAATQPGSFSPDREPQRAALYYYYVCSLTQALQAAEGALAPELKRRWAADLADEVCGRQRADGSWVNPAGFLREDDPLLATALAVRALAVCRILGLPQS